METDTKYTVQDIIEITPQDLNDIFITAIEGGVNYWADVLDANRDETKCALVDKEDETEHWHLTEAIIFEGLKRYLASDVIKRNYTPWPGVGEFLELCDATDADNIVQFGLFNEVRYG